MYLSYLEAVEHKGLEATRVCGGEERRINSVERSSAEQLCVALGVLNRAGELTKGNNETDKMQTFEKSSTER